MALKSILVATDLKEASEPAFIRAIQLSQTTGAELHVLHVIDRLHHPDASADAAAFRDRTVAAIRKSIRRNSRLPMSDKRGIVHIESHGRVYERILQKASSVGASLIVMGRSVRPGVLPNSVFLTTGQVLANASAPVLVVTQPATADYRRILLEADPSMSQTNLMTLARVFAGEARLTILVRSIIETHSAGPVERLFTGFRRRRREGFAAAVTGRLRAEACVTGEVLIDFVSDNYEGVLLSKLSSAEYDLIGLTNLREKLHRSSEKRFIAALQTACCDVLTQSRQ